MIQGQDHFYGCDEHLIVLLEALEKNDISIWNNFVENHNNDFLADLRGANLRGKNLRGAKLQNGLLTDSYLSDSDFRGAVLTNASLCNTDLSGADFRETKLVNVDFSHSLMSRVNFIKADLTGCNLSDSRLNRARFYKTRLAYVDLSGSDFIAADLRAADLRGAKVEGVNFSQATLSKADLTDTEVVESNLFFAKLRESTLIRTAFIDSDLRNVDFSASDLTKSNLCKADLRGARLSRSILKYATLTGAKLYNIKFDNWNIYGSLCEYVYLDKRATKRLPESGSFKTGEFESYFPMSQDLFEQMKKRIKKGRDLNRVFISYVREDTDAVNKLIKELQQAEIDVWMDTANLAPGVDFELEIKRAIENGIYFIACFSHHYWNRKKHKTYMNKELRIAVEQLQCMPDDQVWFIPVKLTECDIPTFTISGTRTLESKQWVQLYENWEEGIGKIIDLIREQGDD